MIKQVQCIIDGKHVYFCQVESIEQAKKMNLPDNVFSFWEIDGKRIYNPAEMVSMIQVSIKENEKSFENLNNEFIITNLYNEIMNKNKTALIENFKKIRNEYIKAGYSMESVQKIDETIKFYEGI